jgi:hypothetical protein
LTPPLTIQSAARSVCRDDVLRRQQCYESTVENVVNRVDEFALTAVHHDETRRLTASSAIARQ